MFTIFLFLLSFSTSLAYAGEAEMKSALQKSVPQLGPIQQIHPSPVPGLYEVVTQERLFYTDGKTRFLIDGAIFDLKNMQNITEVRAQKIFAIDFKSLPFEFAVKIVKGNGERQLAVFTDPNCSFCKKLEKELALVDNVTIYEFMYPVFQGSAEKVKGVWCSQDRVKTWNNLMLHDIMPAAGNCDTPTEQVLALGRKLKVNGTPALIFADGTRKPGYLPAAELEKALSAAILK